MLEIYSNETISKVKEYAAYLMTIEDIAVLVNVDSTVLKQNILNRNTPISKAYYSGKTTTVFEIRKQEVELAKIGSPMAVENSAKYISEQDISESDYA